MSLKVGSIINNKYEILKSIGTGGMSTVYIALDVYLNKNWAIKEIIKLKEVDKSSKAKMTSKEIEYNSLLVEIEILKKLDHLYLPRIVDRIEDDERILVVMDYIEGKTLHDVVEAEGGLPQEKVLKWATQLATVLGYLHSRTPSIIYRDMKPSNIMLQPDGNIKLFDFGASREYVDESSWKTIALGTRGYSAPERYGSNSKFDVRSDIYELGMTLYHLVTGHDPSKTPEEVKPISAWIPSVNKGLEKIINKMTETDPNDRYQSTEELLYDLTNYYELDPIYRSKLSKKLNMLAVTGVASLGFFLLSGLSFVAHSQMLNWDFNKKLEESVSAGDPYLAIEATTIVDNKVEPYLALVDMYKKDFNFKEVEEVQLLGVLNTNKSKIQDEEEYSKLALELGSLYYFYGSTLDSSEGKAVKWLTEASKTKSTDSLLANQYLDLIHLKQEDTYGYYRKLREVLADSVDSKEKLDLSKELVSVVETGKKVLQEKGVTEEHLVEVRQLILASTDPIDFGIDSLNEEIRVLKPKLDKLMEGY